MATVSATGNCSSPQFCQEENPYDENLAEYRRGYEKLIQAANKSQESENRLLTKCRELKAKIVSNSVKVDTALKLTEDDESLVTVLQKPWSCLFSAGGLKFQKDIQACHDECSSETLRKEKAEKELEQLHAAEDKEHLDIRELNARCGQIEEEERGVEEKLRADGAVVEAVTEELEELRAKNAKLRHENEQTAQTVEHLSLENQQRTSDLKTSEDLAEGLRQEISRLEHAREVNQKRLHLTEDQKMDTEQQRDMLRSQIAGLERELELNQKQMKIDKKAIRELMREKDIVNKNLIKAATAAKKQLNVVKLHEQSKKNLELEIKNYKDEARKQQKVIAQLEKERDRYINETNGILEEVHHLMEETRERELEIFEYRKKIADVEKEVKHQQHLYEAVRCDKTIYSKHLNEMQAEMTDMKTQLKMMQCDADQLKEELHGKGCAFEKETLEFLDVEDENKQLKVDLHNMKERAHETKHVIDTQEVEESKLLKVIEDTDAELVAQRKQLSQVIRERDILGRLLVERNKKVEFLYKRMKVQQYVMNKGDMHYNQMVENIQLLKVEIKKLAQEKKIVAKKVSNIEDLRREVNLLQKELLKEQTMCKTLEEDIQILKNVHRWRKLKICDPGTYQLIQKIHFLQTCLITKSKELEETELLLQRRQKSCVQLKHVLARQPGPEVAEQLKIYQQTMRGKRRQLQSLRSDVNTCMTQKMELKNKIDILDHELKNVTNKYIAKKRQELETSAGQAPEKASSPRTAPSVPDASSLRLANISSAALIQRMDSLSAGCLRTSACPRTSER
ncbi:cilia- and flagella-associated protein 58-like [Anguilla rostrata]|uniref:cilia- and flagella-associated protein 58-like n=1 Tax=Anguilla rostrata TaxID=7938 RepID=UPI0030CEA036